MEFYRDYAKERQGRLTAPGGRGQKGSHILSLDGRFIQIWKSSIGLGASVLRTTSRDLQHRHTASIQFYQRLSHIMTHLSSGNISLWLIPAPAVIHCTSPSPNRAEAPMESLWSHLGPYHDSTFSRTI